LQKERKISNVNTLLKRRKNYGLKGIK